MINILKQMNYGFHAFVGIFLGIPWSDINMPWLELKRKNLDLEQMVELLLNKYELQFQPKCYMKTVFNQVCDKK
jgi:hypothetical protein